MSFIAVSTRRPSARQTLGSSAWVVHPAIVTKQTNSRNKRVSWRPAAAPAPAFVRTPEAVAEVAVPGRELDRSKGVGGTHDAGRDRRHDVDLADDGKVMASCRPAGLCCATCGEYHFFVGWSGVFTLRCL